MLAMWMVALAAVSGPSVKWVPLNSKSETISQPGVVRQKTTSAESVAVAKETVAVAQEQELAKPGEPEETTAPVVAAQVGQPPLAITCFGGGTANKPAATTAFSSGHVSGMAGGDIFSASGSGTTTVVGTRQQGFGDQVDIRLFNGDDRIRMPRTMLPAIRGGKDGWFKLKDVVADSRSIRASAAVNFINNPKVFIDRVTGTISISGKAGDYAGQCQVIDASAPAKF